MMIEKTTTATTTNNKPSRDNLRRITLDRIKICVVLFIIYLFLNLLDFGCPIKGFSGISCPGCGMTRAVLSALQFRFQDAFYYHPLFFLTPIMFFLFLFDPYVPIRYRNISWSIIILLFITTYLFRLIFTYNEVVRVDIHSGLIAKLLHYLGLG